VRKPLRWAPYGASLQIILDDAVLFA